MKERFNVKTISKNVQSLKKKLKKTKSQRSIDHPTSEKDNYLKNIYNDPDLVDYREPEWDDIDHLPTKSVEDDDNSDEESAISIDDQINDNNPQYEPVLSLDKSEVVPGHYAIKKRSLEVANEVDEGSVAEFIPSSNPVKNKGKFDKHNEPALSMEDIQAVPGHYRIKKRQLEIEEDDEQAVAKFISSSSQK